MTISLKLGDLHDSRTSNALQDISLAVAHSKRTVIVTGAGISCSCGIPDFRSTDGLYNLVKSRYPDVVVKGKDLFDAGLFRDPKSTAIFYTFISGLKKSIDVAKPSPTHRFIKTLEHKGKLLRSYTQNIDGLEDHALPYGSHSPKKVPGLDKGKAKAKPKDVKNVLLHGDIHRVRCTLCSVSFPCTKEHLDAFSEATPPPCPECSSRSAARVARSARPLTIGTLRPAIVLYNEAHPQGEDIGAIETADLKKKPDLLIIMGTSLKVDGLKTLVKNFASVVHQNQSSNPTKSKRMLNKVIFVNLTEPPTEWADIIDYHVQGTTDSWTQKVIEDWKRRRPADWEVQLTLNELSLKVVKDAKATATTKPPKAAVTKKLSKEDSENIAPTPSSSQSSQGTLVDPFDMGSQPIRSQPKSKTVKAPQKARQKSISAPNLVFSARAPPLSPSKRQNRTYASSNKTRSASSDTIVVDDSECDSDVEAPVYDSESERSSPRKKTKTWRRGPDDMSLDDITVPQSLKRGLLFPKSSTLMSLR